MTATQVLSALAVLALGVLPALHTAAFLTGALAAPQPAKIAVAAAPWAVGALVFAWEVRQANERPGRAVVPAFLTALFVTVLMWMGALFGLW